MKWCLKGLETVVFIGLKITLSSIDNMWIGDEKYLAFTYKPMKMVTIGLGQTNQIWPIKDKFLFKFQINPYQGYL